MGAKRDPKLYNKAVADAFRQEAKRRSRAFSPTRRFLYQVAKALAGKDEAWWAGIQSTEHRVLLGAEKTEQYWKVVEKICDAIPALHSAPTEFYYLGIFAARQR